MDVDAVDERSASCACGPTDGTRVGNDETARMTIWKEARVGGLEDSTINRVYREGDQRQSGTGYGAIESATVARVERQATAANSARAVGVDVRRGR